MTDQELQDLVCKISQQFFAKPFLHTATFNKRLRTTGGRYLLQTHNIEINPQIFRQYDRNELIGVIKHELCHYHLHLEGKGYQHRDRDFKQLLQEVAAPRYCQTLKTKDKYYEYICKDCAQLYYRKQNINVNKYRCSKCSGEIYKKM